MGSFVVGVLLLLVGVSLLVVSARARAGRPQGEPAAGREPLTGPQPDPYAAPSGGAEAADQAAESGQQVEPAPAKGRRSRIPVRAARPVVDGQVLASRLGTGLGTAFSVLGALLLLVSCFYRQDVGEAVVLRTPGGTIAGTDTTAGFSPKLPWNSVVRYDVRNQVITMAGDGGLNGPAITAQTSDNATGSIDITIRYSINPTAVADIYQQYRTQENLVARALEVDVRSAVRDIPVRYSAGELRQRRVEVTSDILTALTERWEPIGVTVDSVDLRDIRYPQEIEQSLAAVQTARSRVEQARADLETARISAERVKTEAQAQSDSDQIIRCGATTTTVEEVVSGKKVAAIKVVPVGPRLCQNRLNEQVLTNKYIDMLREAAAKGNTVYVIPPGQANLLNLQAPTPAK